MIVDFSARAKRVSAPKFKVHFSSFHESLQPVELLGKFVPVANGAMINLPGDDTREIPADELAFDKKSLEYFRYALLSVVERLANDDPSAWKAPGPEAKKETDFLRPVFNATLQRGVTLTKILLEMQKAEFPVPEDFLVFLPPADATNPNRDDIIRALVPFRTAQRQALQAGWQEDTVALRITHGAAAPKQLILN